jgi:hypothetical protein
MFYHNPVLKKSKKKGLKSPLMFKNAEIKICMLLQLQN